MLDGSTVYLHTFLVAFYQNSQEVNLMMTPISSLVEKQNNMNSPGAHEPSNIPVQNNIPVTPHPTDKTWIQNMNETEVGLSGKNNHRPFTVTMLG